MTELAGQRKLLGAFYTQSDTASAIARLAVRRVDETVLDPCFGGCAFLEAVRARFATLGSSEPMRRVFGIDIDPNALGFLKGVRGAKSRQFLVKDFLAVDPDQFGSGFDIVVGNPPFIRHHLLSDDSVSRAQARLAHDLKIPKTADSWIYFFHHSLRFLKLGGCLAMVLPGSFLNASYASTARQTIASQFASSDLFLVRRRLFADALESPVIVIARGFGEKAGRCRLSVVNSPAEIGSASANLQSTDIDLTEKSGPWRLALLPQASREALSVASHNENVAQLGSVAKVHIGVVTGSNQFFTLCDSEAALNKLPESVLRPILTTSKQFRGLHVSRAHLATLRKADERILLLDTNGSRMGPRLKRYLSSPAATAAQLAFKCRDRSVWHELDDLAVPDAFLSYVIDRVPRLVLNQADALCTNAIHRVWWRQRSSPSARQAWALSLISSLGALSAELYGRVAGGGALKLEPSEAAALWLIRSVRRSVGITDAFVAASKALAADDWERARDIADRTILEDQLRMSGNEVAALRDGHGSLLALRFSLAARAKQRVV